MIKQSVTVNDKKPNIGDEVKTPFGNGIFKGIDLPESRGERFKIQILGNKFNFTDDIVCFSPAELDNGVSKQDAFYYKLLQEGKI